VYYFRSEETTFEVPDEHPQVTPPLFPQIDDTQQKAILLTLRSFVYLRRENTLPQIAPA
jgi:hypothetical protein